MSATVAPEVDGDASSAPCHKSSGSSPPSPPPELAKQLEMRAAWATNSKAFSEWLAKTPEEALEPELEIVDPHHHLWDMRQLKGFNFLGIMRQQYYMVDEIVDDMVGGGHNITHTCYAEAHSFHSADADPLMAPLNEVVAAQGVAAQFASGKYGPLRVAAGIIGTADLGQFGARVEPLLVACKTQCPNCKLYDCMLSRSFLMLLRDIYHISIEEIKLMSFCLICPLNPTRILMHQTVEFAVPQPMILTWERCNS